MAHRTFKYPTSRSALLPNSSRCYTRNLRDAILIPFCNDAPISIQYSQIFQNEGEGKHGGLKKSWQGSEMAALHRPLYNVSFHLGLNKGSLAYDWKERGSSSFKFPCSSSPLLPPDPHPFLHFDPATRNMQKLWAVKHCLFSKLMNLQNHNLIQSPRYFCIHEPTFKQLYRLLLSTDEKNAIQG